MYFGIVSISFERQLADAEHAEQHGDLLHVQPRLPDAQ